MELQYTPTENLGSSFTRYIIWRYRKMSIQLVNLTPHEIVILREDCELHIPPSGVVARCETKRETIGYIDMDNCKIPVSKTAFGKVEGLPGPVEGKFYIVSSIVAQAARDRKDLLIPDDSVRDNQGRIIGVRALAKVQ